VQTGVVRPSSFPEKLSQTGCTAPGDAARPADGLIPYTLNSPLWSDGADKDRYLAIPDGTTITIGADGDWDFPNRSVLVKTFSLAGTRIETRLFVRHEDGGWAGYTYEWDPDGRDATLLPGSKSKAVGAQTWAYPSRSQCLQCHTTAAGGTLGLETMNMLRDEVYPSTNRISPQVATLEHIGMFSAAVPQGTQPLPSPADTTTAIDARARSYLHTNCSHCHRPGGGGQGMMDLRYTLPLAQTNTCNAQNTQGAIGGADRLLVPMRPTDSLIAVRMRATDSKRMPSVAVSIPDTLGIQVVEDFIAAQAACP
jgi:uncharacterized repeat protein (TIGR03806 family)